MLGQYQFRWITSVFVIAMAIALVSIGLSVSFARAFDVDDGEASLLYHAYYRKAGQIDPGTIHLFISNSTPQRLKVSKIYLDGYEMTDLPNDLAVWYQAMPCIAQPDEVTDIMVKLRRPPHKRVRISATLTNGEAVSAVVEPVPPSLKFSFIGFDKERDKAYLYLENTGKDDLRIKKLFCNMKEITGRSYIPERVIPPFSKALVIFEPKSPLQQGRYLVFKALTDQGVAAVATSRVYSHFPITAFGGDTRASRFLLQEHLPTRSCPTHCYVEIRPFYC